MAKKFDVEMEDNRLTAGWEIYLSSVFLRRMQATKNKPSSVEDACDASEKYAELVRRFQTALSVRLFMKVCRTREALDEYLGTGLRARAWNGKHLGHIFCSNTRDYKTDIGCALELPHLPDRIRPTKTAPGILCDVHALSKGEFLQSHLASLDMQLRI